MEVYTNNLAKPIHTYRPYWAKRFGTAKMLPMSRAEMDELGWDSCDIILITGDCYIDHPSFGMALVGRLLEAQGFRVGIIAQPDWTDAKAFKALGKPNLYFGITAGNMDSMVNRYTADKKIRSDDAYTPDAAPNKRPDRAVLVYSQRCREAYSQVPLVIGSIEASLRRIAHYDYWSDKVRRSILVDSKADILLYGNAERALVELSHRIAKGEKVADIQDIRGTAFLRKAIPEGWDEIESTKLDRPGTIDKAVDPYEMASPSTSGGKADASCAEQSASAQSPSPTDGAETFPSPAGGRGARGEGQSNLGEQLNQAPTSQSFAASKLPEKILAFARELRTNQTDAEELIWELVRAKRFLGIKFRRQHPVSNYILDFYCDSLKLAIELDGSQHAENVSYDEKRSAELHKLGIETLRFWNNDVLANTESVLEAIFQQIIKLNPSLLGSPFQPLSPFQPHSPSPLAPLPQAGEGNKISAPSPSQGEGGDGGVDVGNISTMSSLTPTPTLPLKDGGNVATIAMPVSRKPKADRSKQVVRLPDYEAVSKDPILYAHASRVLHLEANPGNARALVQKHGDREVWLNPPPIPLTTKEMDYVYDMPYARAPHPTYGKAKIPAWEMIRFSVNIMRGCFGGCTFCSITEHEGRIIQSRSEESILKEVEEIRDKVDGFTGVISDLGGPTANMYRIACKSEKIEQSCRKLSCVYPGICENLNTDHSALIQLYRKARAIKGVKKILIGSGLRYDLAVKSPEYVKELVQHHVGGYLKIAPEHSEENVLSKMMKPGMGAYDEFKAMFEKFSAEVGKKQYLIPYFIASHPGTTDDDMLNLALWLKKYEFRLDQVQNFTPTPMAMATAMYHSGKNPLRKVTADSESVAVPKSGTQRKLHKAFIRYHDPANWPMLREALKRMGRADLIGNSKKHLVPAFQPAVMGSVRQSDGSAFIPKAGKPKVLPKAFNNFKNAARPTFKKH
jgi:radical SAM superfamily enzyme YgiQ (UPF0313 family)/very-short-patch-repair endonuclease